MYYHVFQNHCHVRKKHCQIALLTSNGLINHDLHALNLTPHADMPCVVDRKPLVLLTDSLPATWLPKVFASFQQENAWALCVDASVKVCFLVNDFKCAYNM